MTVEIAEKPIGGSFTLSMGTPQGRVKTDAIPFDASPADIDEALINAKPVTECPLDMALLKLLVPRQRCLCALEYLLKKNGRDTDSWELRLTLGNLQRAGRVMVFSQVRECRDGEDAFGLTETGFKALTDFLRTTSRTEARL